MIRYRLWLDGNGRPSVVACVGPQPDERELEQIRTVIRNTTKREGVLILDEDWEVMPVPQADERLRRIEVALDRLTTWSGMFTGDGRPLTASEHAEIIRNERDRAEANAAKAVAALGGVPPP